MSKNKRTSTHPKKKIPKAKKATSNGNGKSKRRSGYIPPKIDKWYGAAARRAAKLDGLKKISMGNLLLRIAQFDLKLDMESLKKYSKVA